MVASALIYHVAYSQNAEIEIIAAYHWIAERAPVAAIKWRDELILRIEALALKPLAHPLAAESAKFAEDVRQVHFGKQNGQYRVLFTVRSNEVIVLSLRHSRRKPLGEGDLAD